MKTILLLLLLAAAVAMYYGYGPNDLVSAFEAPKPATAVKHVHAGQPIVQVPTAKATAPQAPVPEVPNTTVVIATAPDGSLEHRFSVYPSASPTPTSTIKR